MNFQILGPLRVVDDEQREVTLGGVKRAAVLALLLVHPNEVVSADRLIEELWEGAPPPTAAKSLQVHISRVRRALGGDGAGGPIVTTQSGYMLEVDPEMVDALRFERLVAEGRAALVEGNAALASSRLRCALELWRGDALADFAYASFAQEPVARLDGLRTVALEGAVEAELELGRHAELIPELKSLVRQYPLSERLRGQLMLALYRSGRQAEALGVYRAGRRILVDQLGIEPGAELRELERSILAQDPGLDAPAPERERRRVRAPGAPGGLLVGYEHELSALEDALERALVGQGRVALLSGEPGVGKTRLADELTRVAQARGADVFWARCWNGGGTPAFWPWTQALRSLVADRDPAAVRAELGDRVGDLAQLLPELGAVRAASDPHDARFGLFDATSAFIRRAALARPLVLVFDDLHTADASTLALLGFIGASSPDTPLLLLGTYRDTDVAGNEALTEALTELTRSSDCVQLVLTGLTGEDTAHFVELSSGIAPMGTLAAAIHDVSAGNPLFVSELVRLLQSEDRLQELAGGDALVLPRGVDQVIARRIQQLSAAGRTTLSLAAVIGPEFDPVLLESASETDPADLLEQLAEAESARIIERVNGGGRLRFSHDLVRHSLYGALKARERSRAHLAIAEAIERLDGTAVNDLAHHYAEALPLGESAAAIRYTTLAGDAAAELLAYEDAAALYRRAIEIASARAADARTVSELYVKLAEQCVKAIDAPATAAALDRAEALAGDDVPASLKGRIALARAEYDLFDVCASGVERVAEVIAMYEEMGDIAGQARAWDGMTTWAHSHARMRDEYAAAERTLELARQAGSKALAEQALRGLGCGIAFGDTPVSVAEPRVRALMDQATNPKMKARFFMYLAALAARHGRFDDVRMLLAEAETVSEDPEFVTCTMSQPVMQMELLAGNAARAETIGRRDCADLERRGLMAFFASDVVYLVEALIALGKLEEAEYELARGEAVVVPSDLDALHGQARARARLHLARHELDKAEASARLALARVDEMQWPDPRIDTQLVLAETLFEAGRAHEAREVADEALTASEAIEHRVYAQQARRLLGTTALV